MALDPVSAALDLAGNVINNIWPDKTEQEKAELALIVATVQGQMAVNQTEAAHPSVFVSGWRPYIGWVCGMAFAWNWIGLPVTKVALSLNGIDMTLEPASMAEMMPVLLGMLGLAGMRTYERVEGVARK